MTYRATEDDAGKRVETILLGSLEVSHGLLSRLKRRERGICVNDQRVYATYVLKAGDLITADVGDHEPPRHLEPVEMDLSVVYEDEQILLVSKDVGMLTQKASGSDVSLNEYVIGYLLDCGAVSAESLQSFRPSVCNRLDRNT